MADVGIHIEAAALAYAGMGWAVFPCNGKRPLTSRGYKDATADTNTIRHLWGKSPSANVAISTGTPSGIWVLDIDGEEGEETLAALERQHGPLPRTAMARTGGGGRHLLFRYDGEPIKNRAGDLGPGLDVRATGGYIVAPPSVHPETGVIYEWGASPGDTELAKAPAWLTALVCGENRSRRERPESRRAIGEGEAEAEGRKARYVARAVEKECQAVAETRAGGRNDRLNEAAYCLGRYVGSGWLRRDRAEASLFDAAARCGLIEEDGEPAAAATIKSGLETGMRHPRMPPDPEPRPPARPADDAKRAYAETRRPAERPTIRVVPGELPRMVDEAEAVLVKSEAPVFQRGSLLVTVGNSVIKTRRGEVKGPRLAPVTPALLVEELTLRAGFEKYDARSEGWKAADCPEKVAATYLARPRWKVRPLMGIVETPTLRWDGTVLSRPGYDEEMGLILVAGGPNPAIPDQPTKGQAAAALAVLREPLREFPFVTPADRAVALSGILTAVSRRAYQSAPLHAFSAPVAGTGKGKLVDVPAMIVSGRPAPVIAPGKKEEETEKRLGGVLIAGDPILSIDNVEHPLGGELLCQMLTQPSLKVRILGTSDLIEVPPNMAMFATGNNLEIAGDMTRRTLLCQLDPKVERPELREFAFDPVALVAQDRGRYLGAALTVLRAHIVAGLPGAPAPLGSFEDWSNIVRGALLWLGEADPVATMEAARESDPVLSDLRTLLSAWADTIGPHERLTAAKLIERANEASVMGNGDYRHPELREALTSIAGDGRTINSRRLGRWLKAHSRRIVGGFRLVMVEEDKVHGAAYRLEKPR